MWYYEILEVLRCYIGRSTWIDLHTFDFKPFVPRPIRMIMIRIYVCTCFLKADYLY